MRWCASDLGLSLRWHRIAWSADLGTRYSMSEAHDHHPPLRSPVGRGSAHASQRAIRSVTEHVGWLGTVRLIRNC